MGRAAITIDVPKLQSLVDRLEGSQKFANWTGLCQSVSDADIALECCKAGRKPKQIHPGQVYLAIKRGDITIKTSKGKKGRAEGSKVARTSREDKFAHPNIQLSFANLRKDATAKYQPLVERAASGSKDALIKLMCAQCMGWSGMEKACEADGTNQPPCALYPLNLTYWPKRANPERFTYDPMSKK